MHHIHMKSISNYESDLKSQVKASLNDYEFYKKTVENLQQHQIEQHNSYFHPKKKGLLTYKNRMYILDLA